MRRVFPHAPMKLSLIMELSLANKRCTEMKSCQFGLQALRQLRFYFTPLRASTCTSEGWKSNSSMPSDDLCRMKGRWNRPETNLQREVALPQLPEHPVHIHLQLPEHPVHIHQQSILCTYTCRASCARTPAQHPVHVHLHSILGGGVPSWAQPPSARPQLTFSPGSRSTDYA
jgi:hypothetical protein